MKYCRCFAGVALGFGLVMVARPAAAQPRPIVVELFTSQGCSSCPPADALLDELARRPEVLALGYHISYWDSPGWKDPLSSEASTDRQRIYGARFNGGQVYTPEMVVEGAQDLIGSDRAAVETALHQARPTAIAPVTFTADRHGVAIGSGAGDGDVWLMRFVRHRTTQVAAGENAGRTAQDTNGVRDLTKLGRWDGSARSFPVAAPAAGEGVAVLVQSADGTMLGAAAINGAE